MKVVKSAEHYTETALDEIKLLKSVSLIKQLKPELLFFDLLIDPSHVRVFASR